jgi:Cys-tRNA(Pro) deacylase
MFKKKSVLRVKNFLSNFDKNLKIITLNDSAKTALDASRALNCEVGAIIKSLLFRVDNLFILCLVSGDKKCSLIKLKKLTNKKNISMAKPEEVKTQTGYTIGGVSPVGHLNSLKILIDSSLERFKDLYAAAGHPNCVFKIDFKTLCKITNGDVKELTE